MKRNVFKHWIAILLPLMIILVLLFFLTALSNLDKGNALEEKEQLEKSIREYIDAYSKDEQKLGEAKEEVEKLFENADGLTAEELQNKVKKIFQ